MQIDHEKFLDLLAEAAGQDREKVEDQLEELISEIREAVDEGEAYEVEGFGIFSGMGNNLVFIPAKDLETEINYKYVGMEPIELESPEVVDEPETPRRSEEKEYEDPFGFIYEDKEEAAEETGEEPESEAEPVLPESGSEEQTGTGEETEEEDVFGVAGDEDIAEAGDFPGDEKAEPLIGEQEEEATEPEELADEEEESELVDETSEELEAEADAEEEKPGTEKWGIDSYKDEESESVFSGLIGDDDDDVFEDEPAEAKDEAEEESPDQAEIEAGFLEEEKEKEAADQEMEEEAVKEESEESDPFDALLDEDEKDEEVIPVIKGISSRKKPKKAEKPAPKEKKAPEKPIRKSTPAAKQPVSPALMVLLVIIVLAGGTAALGYFGVINIPGITPKVAVNNTPVQQEQPATPPQSQPGEPAEMDNNTNVQEAGTENAVAGNMDDAGQVQEEEPVAVSEEEREEGTSGPAQDRNTETTAPEGQDLYGMMGVPVDAANDGYTIVLYSLTNEQSARAKQQELSDEGYRAQVFPVNSAQYGTLYRVSIGQFKTITDAAIASEEMSGIMAENYFITKIK